MIDMKISEEIKELCPSVSMGLIQAKVKVAESSEELLNDIDKYCSILQNEIKLEELASEKAIKDLKLFVNHQQTDAGVF